MAGYDTMTPDMWQAVIAALGPQAAEAWRKRGNIPVQGMPLATPSQPAPASATLSVAQQGLNAVEEPEAEDTGALGAAGGFGTVPSAQEWSDLQKRQTAFDQQRAAANQARFEEGQKLIQQMYGGPSTSDRLWALSRALLAPKPTRGFAGTMASVAGAMSGIAEERQAAERKRAEALLGLRQSYERSGEEAQGYSLQRQLDMLKARQAAAGKLAPTVQLDAQGRLREVPKQVHRPVTRAQYDAVPVGDYYVVPSGPKAGQIVVKTATGM